MKSYLMGRAGRREYWIWLVAINLIAIAINLALRNNALSSLITFFPWLVIGARRLRDVGWPLWLVLYPITSGFIIGFLGGVINALSPGGPIVSPTLSLLLIGLSSWAFLIYLGTRPSLKPAPSEIADAF